MSSDNPTLAFARAEDVNNNNDNNNNNTKQSFYFAPTELLAGSTAGFMEHFAMFPFDTIKTRIQSGSSSGIISAVRHMWCRERVVHLYRGLFPILLAAIPSHGAYFGTYEAAKRVFGEETNFEITISAACATVAHDSISTPFDVVKQRMQMDGRRQFTSSLHCLQHITAEEGARALFISLPTTILMNLPHVATYWLVYEGFLAYMGGERRDRANELAFEYIIAGLLAGATASIISSPLDVVKTQLQLGNEKRFSKAICSILKTRGVGGFFAGVSARVMYTAPSGAITMLTYETTKKALENYGKIIKEKV